jgi:hypothetical protein
MSYRLYSREYPKIKQRYLFFSILQHKPRPSMTKSGTVPLQAPLTAQNLTEGGLFEYQDYGALAHRPDNYQDIQSDHI